MATRNKPYDSFGPFILFKKLESDSLGDVWRAARIDGGQLGPAVALRRLSGGNREALSASAHAASEIVPQLSGASFVRGQVVGVTDNVPFLAWEYQGGRSLRYIVDRARGGNGVQPNPVPMDQAIVIAERIALSLATTSDLRDGAGQRLSHGALIPQFVWISDDGEIRVAGQLLSAGITASLADQKVASEIARYFAPESRGAQQKTGEVYALGALLFLLVTGQEPPDAATASAFGAAVRAAKTMSGAPIPDDIRIILDKSFNIDPSMRYQSIGDMKQALNALANGGKYTATTFNLAFYLSTLLKKEMEAEAIDREKESKVNVAPYLEAPKPVSAPVAHAPAAPVADFHASVEKKKNRMPVAIAAGIAAVAAISFGGWVMLKKTGAQPAAAPVQAQVIPVKPKPPVVISEPIVTSGSTDTAAPAATDTAAQQKAFEDAVKAKMQAEMMKLQDQFLADLKKSQPKSAPVTIAPPVNVAPREVAAAEEREAPSAAQLDQQRVLPTTRQEPAQTTSAAPAPVQQTQTSAPVVPQPQIANTQPAAPAVPTVREGDIVNVTELDVVPRRLRAVQPLYPPMARSQRLAAVIMVTALINENGQVTEVKVLRGEERYGLNDAAVRAMKATRFSSPMKNGKKVKTWFPQQFDFAP